MSALLATPAVSDHLARGHYGWFGWNIARGTVVWSNSVFRLHGYAPTEVVPSSTLTFHHKHPEDLYGCIDALHAGMVTNRLIVHEHRLVDASDQIREVVMVCRPVNDGQGHVRNLRGFLLPTNGAESNNTTNSQAPLIQVMMNTFEVSESAAQALLTARRPLTALRSRQQEDFAHRYAKKSQPDDQRRALADSMFPLEHLTLTPVNLAA